jgi:hypothetical protein
MLLLGLLQVFPAWAQFSGRVTGSVMDSSGAAITGADVDLYLAGGKKPVLSVKTSSDGLFHFLGVRPADYDLTVESKGFVKATITGIAVDAAREVSLLPVKLVIATVSQKVEVTAEAAGVDTTNVEISDTITMDEIRNLPILDRDALSILQTQAGVVYNGNSFTVINGLRTSYSNVTLDGINIQDNYIRDNALDYNPNRLLLGQVRQMTLVASNANAAASGGATETAFSTPSGTNKLTGEAFWYNRNDALAANDWFNNQAGVPLPFLNQNQMGASVGGPIKKDKLFFYTNYEAVRTHQQTPQDETILTATAREGIFTYNNGSTPVQVNVLALRNITTIAPEIQNLLNQVPLPSKINNFLVGDSTPGDLRNTAGYRFNQRDNETRDNVTGKIDYNISTSQAVSGAYLWNRDNSDRPDLENDYSLIPKVTNPTHANFLSVSWRWTPTAHITNEMRAGFNMTYGYFLTSQQFGPYILTGMDFSDPVNEFLPQGRTTNTFALSDDAAYQRGSHYFQFGFHGQKVFVRSYDDSGVVPTYNLYMGSGQPALSPSQLPGIGSTDYQDANALLATLGGYIDSYSQTFNIISRTSGYVPGQPYLRHFIMGDYNFYGQDKWKVSRRLTLTIGMKWELPGVVTERNSLEVEPEIVGGAVPTLLSNATLNWAGSSVGRPWYDRHWRDFSPNVGLAWDIFGDGKTAFRTGYAITRVNDQEILAPENMMEANSLLQGVSTAVGLSNTVGGGVPSIPVPAFAVPSTISQEYATNTQNTVGLVDPNLNRPYVQQYTAGIQHEFKGTVYEARYVGNHQVGQYRAFDFNQVQIVPNGFLADFLRAQNNGFLALSRTGIFNPAYNAGIPGSQQLTVFPELKGGGYISGRNQDPNVIYYLEDGEAAQLANYYQINGEEGNVSFYQNPYALGADMLTNYSSSSYNSLQLVARHHTSHGLSLEANYTWGKVLSDGDGDVSTRFQAFLDFNNPKLERSRANYDLNQMIKGDGYYELPIGKGKWLSFGRVLDRVVGGWIFGETLVWQSGAPFSVLSGYGTLNSELRSYYNTAVTALDDSQLKQIVHFQMTGNGPMEIAPSAINQSNGTGVSAPGTASFAGEVFFNPTAGNLGTLQRRQFSGPWTFTTDMSLLKSIAISDRHSLDVRMEAYNALNHPTFWSGDQNINSTTFGVISSMFYNPRVLQFGAHYRF